MVSFQEDSERKDVKEYGDQLERQRTIQQNKCLHQYFAELATDLNGAGYNLQTAVSLPITITPENVKANIAYRFIAALFPENVREDGTFHTSDLNTKQIKILFECMNAAMADKFKVSHMWPDRFNGGKC